MAAYLKERPGTKRGKGRLLVLAVLLVLLGGGLTLRLRQDPGPQQQEILAPERLPEEPVEPELPPEEPVLPEEPEEPAEPVWNLRLVNPTHPLPEGYEIPELTKLANGHAVDARAYPELQQMMDDCRAAGHQPLICSSYRPHETQVRLFRNKMDRLLAEGCDPAEVEAKAAEWVAIPGTSEHEGGLALDIVDVSYQLLDDEQENTPAQQWLMAHCQDYGFILRYPRDKTEITGIGYEPWHYRYVGKEAAREIMAAGICLEEYLGAE